MRQVGSPSFEFFEPDKIEQANVVEHLVSPTRNSPIKAGVETWACAWAPDNTYFAWSSGHGCLHLVPWDSRNNKRHNPDDTEGLQGREYHIVDCAENIWALAFGSGISQTEGQSQLYRHCNFDNHLLVATGLASGRIKIWDCYKGALMIELLDHRDTIRCLDFARDGSLQLISGSRDGTLKLWDLWDEGNMYSTHKSPTTKFLGCRFSPNGRLIAAVGTCKMVHIWTKRKLNSQPLKLSGHCNEVVSCDFSADSSLLATAAYDTKVIIWNMFTMQQLRTLGHMHPSPRLIFAGGANDHYVRCVSFCSDGTTVATVCDDGYIRFWNLAMKGDPKAICQISDAVSCQFSTNGRVLAVGFRSGDVEFLTTPLRFPTLLHLTRQAIRKHVAFGNLDQLPLPPMLIQFLHYHDFRRDDASLI